MVCYSFLAIVLSALIHAVQSDDARHVNLSAGCDSDGIGQMMLQVAAGAMHREQQSQRGISEEGYYWSQRGGDSRVSSSTSQVAPSDFSVGPTWTWENALDEQVRHSPLIDDKLNIYVTTTTRIRKFSPDGAILWTWQCLAPWPKISTAPALHKGQIIVQAGPLIGTIYLFSLDMATGSEVWSKSMPGFFNEDANALTVANDTIFLPMHYGAALQDISTNKFLAVSSADGSPLWEFVADEVIWNAAPATPGDGTLLFSGTCGGAFRISFGGQLLWRAGPPVTLNQYGVPKYCSNGGGAVGPNGVFYTEYSHGDVIFVSAYKISDGTLMWEKHFNDIGNGAQYPAIGKLGRDGPLALVVALGGNPGIPASIPEPFFEAYDQDPILRKALGAPNLRNVVMALDADNGNMLWQWEEEVWDHFAAAGDEGGFERRTNNPNIEGAICLPDMQGIPVIAGDGTVYASSSHGGALTAIKDADGNGIIDPSEVSSFETHNCFLNSPSVAPGMLVAAPCWGPMYVFKR